MSVQVRQCVQIADGLVGQYSDVMKRFTQAWQHDNEAEMSVLRAEVERIYAGIWEQLDDAAAQTRAAGRSIDDYAAIRNSRALDAGAAIANVNERFVGFEPGISKGKAKFELSVRHNAEGIAHAKQAIAALQATWPELDWKPFDEPQVDLRPKGLLSRLFRR
jgi:hypothetical protein